MSLSTLTNRITYAGNGSTTVFSFPYYFLVNADLKVYVVDSDGVGTLQTITTHYTVTGAGVAAGGTVTMLTAPASGASLLILRDPAITQTLTLTNNDALPVDEVEEALDKAMMLLQRLDERSDRSIALKAEDSNPGLELPLLDDRAGMFLAFAADGSVIASEGVVDSLAVSAYAATLLDDANAAAARTTLGMGSTAAIRTLAGFGASEVFIAAGDLASTVITGNTAATTPATDDVVILYDTSAAALRKMALSDLFKNLDTQRNHLYNGNFDIWQRGTSLTCANTATAYCADRWYIENQLGTNGVITGARVAGSSDGAKYGCEVKITTAPTSGSTNGTYLYQTLENFDTLKLYNKNASVSVKLKAKGNVTKVGIALMYKTTEAKIDTLIGSEVEVTVNSSTFTTGEISLQALGTSMTAAGSVGIRIRLLEVSTGNTYDLNNGYVVEQAMLVEGAAPSVFKTRFDSYGEELAACQRYYEVLAGVLANEYLGYAFSTSTTTASGLLPFVKKRIAPTLTASATAGIRYSNASGNYVASGLTYTIVSSTLSSIEVTTSGIAAAHLPGVIDTTSTASIAVNAEI